MKEKILKLLLDLQVEEMVLQYSHIEQKLGIKKDDATLIMIELRNAGHAELVTAFDSDFEFRRGSGWVITPKGETYAKGLGIEPDYQLNNDI